MGEGSARQLRLTDDDAFPEQTHTNTGIWRTCWKWMPAGQPSRYGSHQRWRESRCHSNGKITIVASQTGGSGYILRMASDLGFEWGLITPSQAEHRTPPPTCSQPGNTPRSSGLPQHRVHRGKSVGPVGPVPFPIRSHQLLWSPSDSQRVHRQMETDCGLLCQPQKGQVSTMALGTLSKNEAAQSICTVGKGLLLAKVDVKSAYRNIPVHPEDRWLMGMLWNGGLFVDTTLPFGLHSAPKIFTALEDAVEWIAKHEGVNCV